KWSSGAEKAGDVNALTVHAKETSEALVQFRQRIEELEKEQASVQRRFEAFAKSTDLKVHKVRSGETLKKIAEMHGTTVDKLKRINDLQQDRIVVGQELKVTE